MDKLLKILTSCKNKLLKIYAGWKNLLFPNPEIEELAKKRIVICIDNKCNNLNEYDICEKCGCYIPAKVRSPKEKCPEKLW